MIAQEYMTLFDCNKAVLSWLRDVGLCAFMCAYIYVCPNSAFVIKA